MKMFLFFVIGVYGFLGGGCVMYKSYNNNGPQQPTIYGRIMNPHAEISISAVGQIKVDQDLEDQGFKRTKRKEYIQEGFGPADIHYRRDSNVRVIKEVDMACGKVKFEIQASNYEDLRVEHIRRCHTCRHHNRW